MNIVTEAVDVVFDKMDSVVESIHNFKVTDDTPLMAWYTPAIVITLYLSTLLLIQRHVKNRGKPYDLKEFVSVYNLCLSIASSALFYGLGSELVDKFSTHGVHDVLCDPTGHHTSGKLYLFYYINYIYKYIELVDTFLLFLRNKRVRPLHIYHHAATLWLCHSQIRSESCIQYLIIQFNLGIHIIMYYYYYIASIGGTVWWKKYLTSLQIIQFIFAVSVCTTAITNNELITSFGMDSIFGMSISQCHGSRVGAWFGTSILASYLILFIKLYNDLYSKKKKLTSNTPTN